MKDTEAPTEIIVDSANKPIHEGPVPKAKRKRKKHRSRAARLTIATLRLILLGYTTVLITLVLMESRLVFPGAYFADNPAYESSDPAIATVEYTSADGLTLQGRLLEKPNAPHLVLFFHGNGVKAKWMDHQLTTLAAEFNATVMAAEYRGFNDDMTPEEKGILTDCFAARDFFCKRYQCSPQNLILYGESLGGGCAVAVAAQGGAKALVLERTFDRMVNVAAEQYPYIPVHFLMKNRFDSVAKLTVYRGPLVVIHGTTDKLIPIQHAEALFARAATQQKHWISVAGMGHNDALPRASLREAVAKVSEFTTEVPDSD